VTIGVGFYCYLIKTLPGLKQNKEVEDVMKKIRRFVALFSVSVFLSVVASHARIYVDSAATGANDGTSWEDAYVELTSALATAVEWEEIWVAQGGNRSVTGVVAL
jgi:hypothetical protein